MKNANDQDVEALVAHVSILIAAPRARVFQVLMRPETIMRILPATEVVLEWRSGQPFLWKIDMLGKSYDVKGVVLRVEEDHLLEYEYLDPHSAMRLRIENRHRVTIELADDGAGTRVSLAQDNNLSKAALAHAEGGWRLALNHLKGVVERSERVV